MSTVNKSGIKVYANLNGFALDRPDLLERFRSFVTSSSIFGFEEDFKAEYREFCNEVRELLGVKTVISFAIDVTPGSTEVLVVWVYGVLESEGVTFEAGVDSIGPYIFVPFPTAS
ncbi:hypothetical protein D3C71_1257540 [compost metagenome]